MPLAKLPINQQNALPLLSITDATEASEVSLVGGSVIKKWNAADLGISGAQWTLSPDGLKGYILGEFLDLRGCNHFSAIVERHMTDAPAEVALDIWLLWEFRGVGGAVNPTTQYNGHAQTIAWAGCGTDWLTTGGVGPFPYTTLVARGGTINSWAVGSNVPAAPATAGAFVGYDARPVIYTPNTPVVGANLTMTLTLWGQGP